MSGHYTQGDAYGLPLMKFTLTYRGDLPSAGNSSKKVREKWAIREYIRPQIVKLWQTHPALKEVAQNSWFPKAGAILTQAHHSHDGPPISPLAKMLEVEEVGPQH